MTKAKYLLLIASLCPTATILGQARSQSAPVSLTIRATEDTAKRGSEVVVNARLENVTNHTITFADTNSACDYVADVRDSAGLPAPQTDYKRTLRCDARSADGRRILITLRPGEFREEQVIITRVCDLARPGKYSIRLLRTFPNDIGDGTATSNQVQVVITE